MATSSPDPFDPCRQGLGIDASDLENPRRVLGLLPSEADPITVLKAAEARLVLLKGLSQGISQGLSAAPHHALRDSLIIRVEEAREAVLSEIAATAGRPPASRGGFAMPPPPRRPVAEESAATVVLSESGRMAPGAGIFPDAAPAPSGASLEGGFPPTVRIRPARPIRRQSNAAIWLSLLAMLGSVAAGLGFIWWQANQAKIASRQSPADKAAAKVATGAPSGADVDDRPRSAPPLPEDAGISSSPPPVRVTSRPESTARPVTKPTAPPKRVAMTPPLTATAVTATEDGATMAADDPTDPPPDEPAAAEAEMDTAGVLPSVGLQGGEEPMDGMDTGTEIAPPDDVGHAAIEEGLSTALEGLRKQDFDAADESLAAAMDATEDRSVKQRVAAWKLLAEYARGFARFRSKALDAVRSGNEYDVGGKKIAVVEIDDKKFIYRFQGRNKTVTRDKIPAGIVMAIVTGWFDSRPDNNLFLGAYHATKPEPDLDKAKQFWDFAEAGGIDATLLLGLLSDPLLADSAGPDKTDAEATNE